MKLVFRTPHSSSANALRGVVRDPPGGVASAALDDPISVRIPNLRSARRKAGSVVPRARNADTRILGYQDVVSEL
jgi:hypothetical protein